MEIETLFTLQNIKKLSNLWSETIVKSVLKKFGNVDFHAHDGCEL